jgi:DNA mismatch endonuclease (patch repair protein)
MTDVFNKRQRSEIMAAIRSKDTRPEVAIRSMLHRMGLRFRLHVKGLPGTPDVVLKRHRKVVEILGCYWHRHPRCRQASGPSSNRAFWRDKFQRNVERDKANRKALRRMGWRTVVVWECELRKPERLERRLRKAFGLGDR